MDLGIHGAKNLFRELNTLAPNRLVKCHEYRYGFRIVCIPDHFSGKALYSPPSLMVHVEFKEIK